ncbi:MAG TPA: ABC transporter permease [Lichenihabitans sp.]|jgi:rhamnose transport system permease protein|nr:ABC transporter permease [Lichenihabitans sp.]
MTAAAAPRAFVWELTLAVLILLAAIWASLTSPFYLSFDQITFSLQQSVAVVGLIALGLVAVVVVGEIDISLPAILALGNILFMHLAVMNCPIWLAVPLVLVVCALAGLFNGLLVVAFGLPSLAVTLGAMGAYRALALLLAGQEGFADFPADYLWLGSSSVADVLPASLVLVALAALLFGFVMHGTVLGRCFFACGLNARAARLSGVRVRLVKTTAFTIGGVMAGLASLVYIGQFQSARADNASDILLFVVTAVVLGGVDIFGGRGNVVGVLLSLLLLGTLKNGMGLANVAGSVQTLVIGTLLIVSVLIAQGGSWTGAFRRLRIRAASKP